jgi:hypothetical protein
MLFKLHFPLVAAVVGWATCFGLALGQVSAAVPELTAMSLRGLRIGHAMQVTFTGSGLTAQTQVVTPLGLAKQTVLPGGSANAVTLEIEVAANAAPGIYPLRVATEDGVSNSLFVGVDRLPQVAFTEQPDMLPVALHGNLSGGQVLKVRFVGQQGMRFVADVEAQRLESKLNPVLRLYDARGRQLSWSPAQKQLGGDARLDIILPDDGMFELELHDLLYRGANPGYFRLKLGELAYADRVFPFGVQRGISAELAVIGGPLETLGLKTSFLAAADDHQMRQPVSLHAVEWLTGTAPEVFVSDGPELTELAEGARSQPLPAAPVAVSGRLVDTAEEDTYLLTVVPGSQLRLELLAQRIGSALDGILVIRGEAGNQLARNDDLPNTPDPGLDFTVPANVEKVVVAVSDLVRTSHRADFYRLVVTNAKQPQFTVRMSTDRLNTPAGATKTIPFEVTRRGYDGPIQLELQGLPSSLSVTGNRLSAGVSRGLLSLSSSSEAAAPSLVRVLARAETSEKPIVRLAQVPETPATRLQPWLSDAMAVAVGRPAAVTVSFAEPIGTNLRRGERVPLNVQVKRQANVSDPVRLQLLTNQLMPKKKIKENNQDKEVDAPERTLRLEGQPTFAAEVAMATAQILVPADLPEGEWAWVLVAERLSADGKQVLETTNTPVQFGSTEIPFSLELTSAKDLQARAGEGETGKLTGTIKRAAGYTKPIKITLVGLPEGYAAPSVDVPAEQSNFELTVRFPAEAKPGELREVKLVGQTTCDFSPENPTVQSPPIPLGTIQVVPTAKP